jgi:dolichol-phosphate mannosyltransferase
VLEGLEWELIFVDDDSSDDTSAYVREIAKDNPKVRCIQRLKRRGLSSACIEGILASYSPYICVMDADLQHDEKLIPEMLSALKTEDLDIVIGSRYVDHGSTGKLAKHRVMISRLGTLLGNYLLRSNIKDPMSGYFMLRRKFFESIMRDLSGRGFKILLDIFASTNKEIRYRELPYSMRNRAIGTSKLDSNVVWDFFMLMMDKLFGRIFPIRFVLFSTVGLSGVFVHFISLSIIFGLLNFEFLYAQIAGTYIAMTSNFILNNIITYRDIRLRGLEFLRGLISFFIYCSFGALINITMASYLFDQGFAWWLAGVLGAICGAIWNYAVTAVLTWRLEQV